MMKKLHERKSLRCRRGVSSLTSLFLILLMFAILIGLFLAFFDYNFVVFEEMKIEDERSQERIVLSGLELDNQTWLSNFTVRNAGTIEVRVRAIYIADGTTTAFICDPSQNKSLNPKGTYIPPGESLTINLSSGVPFKPEAKIIAATERGVKTKEYEALLVFGPWKPTWDYDPTKLYIGPLMLQFDAFWYRKTFQNGTLDPNDPWHPGWSIPKGFGYCTWNITVMNIDDRNITINRFSTFNVVPNDSPSNEIPWYLEPTNQTSLTQFLPVNQTRNILYTWAEPKKGSGIDHAQKPTLPECTCMVFLTFFGVFHEHDGTTTTYAQTIPFEAAITIVG